MYIALVSESDPTNIRSWSGIPNAILKTLQSKGHTVSCIVPQRPCKKSLIEKLSRKIRTPQDGKFLENYNSWSLRGLARSTRRLLKNLPTRPDVVLSIHPDPIAYLDWSEPIVVTGDATFPLLINYYSHFSGLSNRTIYDGKMMARRGLQNAELTILSSEWAYQGVLKYFPDFAHKVRVLPYGANLNIVPDPDLVTKHIYDRDLNIIRLLSVGVEWERKGLDRVINLVSRLNNIGITATLDLVGCKPPEEITFPDFVRIHGFLDKSQPKDLEHFQKLGLCSSFFVLPSRAECYGIAFAEAAAYGLPSLATDEGGISTAVSHGTSGFLFSGEQFIEDATACIKQFRDNPTHYYSLCESTLNLSKRKLNWQTFVSDMNEMITPLVKEK